MAMGMEHLKAIWPLGGLIEGELLELLPLE
jgi:hypothetical protein